MSSQHQRRLSQNSTSSKPKSSAKTREREENADTVANLHKNPVLEGMGNGNMKSLRNSMAVNPVALNKFRQTVGHAISRASVKFELKDGSDAGNLVIENERLKTSIEVLTQKMKVQDHNSSENEQLHGENRKQKKEIEELKSKVSSLET